MAALEGIMTERAADSGSSAGRDYLDILQTILKDNEGFVSDKCEETYSEVIDLANDAIERAVEDGPVFELVAELVEAAHFGEPLLAKEAFGEVGRIPAISGQ